MITMTVPEVVRGDFIYHDAFFVNVGNHRHPRASINELRNLLLPTQRTARIKDEVGHWYEAQLIHYGLARTKDKNAAKVRLTAAISAEQLAVPGSILQTEAAMKKEFLSNVRKAKAASEGKAVGRNLEGYAGKRSKRRLDASSPSPDRTTKISAKIGNVTFEIEQQTGRKASSAKKPKLVQQPRSLADGVSLKKDTKAANTYQTPTKEKIAETISQPKRLPLSRQQHNIADERPVKHQGDGPVHAAFKTSYHETYEDEPPPRYEDVNQTSVPTDNAQRRGHISGLYRLLSQKVYVQAELVLKICRSSQQFWGQFTIGHKSGVLLCSDTEGISKSQIKTFGWRSEDNMTGDIRFGRGCNGWFQFDGKGSIRGQFTGLLDNENFNFEGDLQSKSTRITINQIQDQWDDFPRIAYGRS